MPGLELIAPGGTINSYLGFVLAAVAVGIGCLAIAWRAVGLPVGWRFLALAATTAIIGLAGGRLYILLEQWRNGVDATGWLDGGFRLPGAVAGMLVGMAVGQRVFCPEVTLARVLDLGALAAQPALVVVRFGCLAAGCCFGTVSGLPWAMHLPRDSQAGAVHQALHLMGPGDLSTVPVHPLAVYFMLLHLALGAVLLWFRRRQTYDGQLLLVCLVIGQGGKALLETFRQPFPEAPTVHLVAASATIAAVAAIGLVVMALRGMPANSGTANAPSGE